MFKKEKDGNNMAAQADTEEMDMPAQLKKISEHLVFLEKKLDTIIADMKTQKPQSQGFGNRPSFQRRPGQYRPEGRPGYYQGGSQSRPSSGNQGYSGSSHQGSSGPNRSHRPSGGGHSRPYDNRPRSNHSSEGNFKNKFSH